MAGMQDVEYTICISNGLIKHLPLRNGLQKLRPRKNFIRYDLRPFQEYFFY